MYRKQADQRASYLIWHEDDSHHEFLRRAVKKLEIEGETRGEANKFQLDFVLHSVVGFIYLKITTWNYSYHVSIWSCCERSYLLKIYEVWILYQVDINPRLSQYTLNRIFAFCVHSDALYEISSDIVII